MRYPDALYLDQVRLMKLRSRAPPLSGEESPELRDLLDLVTHILSPTRSSKNLTDGIPVAKLQAGDGSSSSHSSATATFMNDWQLWASKIARAMSFQDEDSIPEDKAWFILEIYQEIPLKAMAILSLVAFATMYGKAQLVTSSSSGLATSIASFKQLPPGKDTAFRHWSSALSKLLDRTLDVADRVLVMEETPAVPIAGHDTRLLLPSAVHKIINVTFVCWKLVVDIMIKRSWAELHTSLVKFDNYKWKLENKLREFKLQVPIEQPPVDRLPPGSERQSCWWKLRQLLNPANVKAKAQPRLSYTTTQLSLHRLIMPSTTQGALKSDEDDSAIGLINSFISSC